MTARIGIRREDKNPWERRAPLTPRHVKQLVDEQKLQVIVEPASRRVFHDDEYVEAGATIADDLSDCSVILGVKEVPIGRLSDEKPYVCFGHVIKAQPYNMPFLKQLIERRCTLIDYELVINDAGVRIISFGRYAGCAGVVDTLWALGQRLYAEGFDTPLAHVRQAHGYDDLAEIRQSFESLGGLIRARGFPATLHPLVIGFTGEGNVSRGAQEVFDWLPHRVVEPERLAKLMTEPPRVHRCLYKLLLPPARTVQRVDGSGFEWEHYVAYPQAYRADMERWLVHLSALVNGIYWDERYPRLVSRQWVERQWADHAQPTLRVIGDISCDIEGSVQVTVRAANPSDPVYVYDPKKHEAVPGILGHGPVVMAVDNLPTELPKEASEVFADALLPFVPALASCDWTAPLEQLQVPEPIRRAIITHRGQLAPCWRHLTKHLPKD